MPTITKTIQLSAFDLFAQTDRKIKIPAGTPFDLAEKKIKVFFKRVIFDEWAEQKEDFQTYISECAKVYAAQEQNAISPHVQIIHSSQRKACEELLAARA